MQVIAFTAVLFAVATVACAESTARNASEQELKGYFDRLDANKDQKLTVEEFIARAQGERQHQRAATFDKLDANSDRIVTFDELKTAYYNRER